MTGQITHFEIEDVRTERSVALALAPVSRRPPAETCAPRCDEQDVPTHTETMYATRLDAPAAPHWFAYTFAAVTITAPSSSAQTICEWCRLRIRDDGSGRRRIPHAAYPNIGEQQDSRHRLRDDEAMCVPDRPNSARLPPVSHCDAELRHAADVPPEGKGPPDADREPRCLVRTVGAKRKISAMVAAKDYRRFMQSYGNILKVSLDSLKKKEKVKKTINKAEKKETGAKSS